MKAWANSRFGILTGDNFVSVIIIWERIGMWSESWGSDSISRSDFRS